MDPGQIVQAPPPNLIPPTEQTVSSHNLLLIGFIAFIAFLLGSGAMYVLGVKGKSATLTPTPSPVAQASPTPTPDPTASWKTYTISSLDNFGYMIKFPPGWKSIPWASEFIKNLEPYELAQNFYNDLDSIRIVVHHFIVSSPQDDIDEELKGKSIGILKTKSGINAQIVANKDTNKIYAYIISSRGYYKIWTSLTDKNIFNQILSTFRFE